MFNVGEIWTFIMSVSGIKQMERVGAVLQYVLAWAALVMVAFTGDVYLAAAWLYAGIIQIIVVEGLKRALNHTTLGMRPNGKDFSFPSIRTAGAVFGAAFITMVWGFWAGIIPIMLACMVGYSQVISRNHWPRDVVAGAIIALMCTAVSLKQLA
jgi:membrane-associated phospholipid phosphatase